MPIMWTELHDKTPPVPNRSGRDRLTGAGRPEPVTSSIPVAALGALEDIERATKELRALVSWQEAPNVLTDLAAQINDVSIALGIVADVAGTKGDQIRRQQ